MFLKLFFLILFFESLCFAGGSSDAQKIDPKQTQPILNSYKKRNDLDLFFQLRSSKNLPVQRNLNIHQVWDIGVGQSKNQLSLKDFNSIMTKHKETYKMSGSLVSESQQTSVYLGRRLWKNLMSFYLKYSWAAIDISAPGTLGAFNYKLDYNISSIKIDYDFFAYKRIYSRLSIEPGYLTSTGRFNNAIGNYNFQGSAFGTQADLSVGFFVFDLFDLNLFYGYQNYNVDSNTITSSSGIILGLNQGSSGKELEKNDGQNFKSDFTGSLYGLKISYIF